MREGQGIYTWNDKSFFSGTWENDKMHGEGVIQENNQKYRVEFREGELVWFFLNKFIVSE